MNSTSDAYKYFVDKVATMARDLGKTPVQWVEVFENFGSDLDQVKEDSLKYVVYYLIITCFIRTLLFMFGRKNLLYQMLFQLDIELCYLMRICGIWIISQQLGKV